MGLLTWLQDRKSKRRYESALAIYAAAITYRRLDQDSRRKVLDEVKRIVIGQTDNPAIGELVCIYERVAGWHERAAYAAVAMARLSIAPQLIDEWPACVQRGRQPHQRALWLELSFRAMSTDSDRALALLRSKEPRIDELLPSMLDDPFGADVGSPGKGMTVREAILKGHRI